MKEHEIIENLKFLRSIEPEKDFVSGTRRLILVSHPSSDATSKLGLPRWSWALASAMAALFLVIMFVVPQEPRLSSLDQGDIENELINTADLHMDKLEYRQSVDRTIVAALDEISSSQASHMNPTVLEAERGIIEDMEADDKRSQKVGELLNKVTF